MVEGLVFAPPETGGVLYLPGRPGGGHSVYDGSPYGKNGVVTGASWRRLPSGAWHLYFDGVDDFVSCGASLAFDLTGAGTLKVWVSPEAAQADYGIVLGKTGADYVYYIYVDKNYGGPGVPKLIIGVKDSGGYKIAEFVNPAAGRWYHLVGTWDSRYLTAYVNGLVTGVSACGAGVSVLGDAVNLGGPTGARWYKGGIALAEIHNRAWTALEAQNSFHREKHLFGEW